MDWIIFSIGFCYGMAFIYLLSILFSVFWHSPNTSTRIPGHSGIRRQSDTDKSIS